MSDRSRGCAPGGAPYGAWILALCATVVLGVAVVVPDGSSRAPALSAGVASAEATISDDNLRSSVTFLASDALAGRGVGHAGNETAVEYLASMLERFGVTPADDGFLQAVPLESSELQDSTRLEIVMRADAPAVAHRWSVGEEFFPVEGSPSGNVEAPVAFAGYGLSDPEAGRDDFARLDLEGRLVVVLDRRPGERSAPQRTRAVSRNQLGSLLSPELSTVAAKARAAAARGAAGLLVASRERRLEGLRTQWPERPSVRTAHYRLTDERLPIPTARISAEVALRLLDLENGDYGARSVDDLFDGVPGFEVADRRGRLHVALGIRPVTVHNVVGVVEGGDRALRNELVVIGAHLDHDGIDADGRVYNGADDNASGAAAVLEVAEAFARAAHDGERPRRSVVFAFWNAEEKGLLGSRHYVSHVVPSGHHVVANLNLDMVGRQEEVPSVPDARFTGLRRRPASETQSLVHMVGYSFSPDLAVLAKEEARRQRLALSAEYDGHPIDLLRRSDHWPFLQARLPALFFITGLHPDYHTPDDDAGRIDFDKLERIARLAFRLTWRVADADEAPRFAVPAAVPEP